MFGAYDSKPGAGKMINAIHQGKVPAYASGGRNYIYAKDVAVAVVNALRKGRIGQHYIAGNQNLSYREAFNLISDTVGGKPPRFKAPSLFIKAFGLFNSLFASIFGTTPTVSYPMAAISTDEQYFSSDRAIKDLELPQTEIKVAIKECFEWMQDNGIN